MTDKQPDALEVAAFCDGNVLYHPAATMLRAQHAALERKDALLRQARLHVASNIAVNSGDSKAEDLYDAITSELAK